MQFIFTKIKDVYPYEIQRLKITFDSDREFEQYKNSQDAIYEHLMLDYQVIEILETNFPLYTVKVLKENIGIGN